jgi:tRNA-splicing endonuclease subunit Sen15
MNRTILPNILMSSSQSPPSNLTQKAYTDAERRAHLSLLAIVQNNLENQADWRGVRTHYPPKFARPLLTGVPPEAVYVDPDADPNEPPSAAAMQQVEWVLPVDVREKWSLRKTAAVFDSMPDGAWGVNAAGEERKKRLLLAVVSEDSTVVYYFVHDGIVKPRQN